MKLRHVAALLAFAAAAVPACVAAPAIAADRVPMAAHRALYKLTLESVRGGDVSSARGTMAYEVTDACDGWATRQRLAMTITNRDGQDVELISDYATWESKDGLKMSFRMRQTTDTAVTEQAEGTADLQSAGGAGTIHYTVPAQKDMPMPSGTVFPMAHTEAIIGAAAAGKKFLAIPIFDGTGDRGAQDSSIAIAAWGPTAKPPYPALANLASGRVRIAFFDREPRPERDKPAGSPDYEVGMKYWANGVADDLHMDFSDFVMQGSLSEFTETPPTADAASLMPLGLVTGATGGLGWEVAAGLARAGLDVVLTGRSAEKGQAALARLRRAVPDAAAEFALLDVGSLAGIEAFAQSWTRPLDVLVENAGIMALPHREVTVDGFERQLGVNYLGHFALTMRLLPHLLETAAPRVVTVSSLAHRNGRIAFDDLQSERSYSPMRAYQQSKLAMLMFARELQRRAQERGWPMRAIAAHPGWSATSIVLNGIGTGLGGRLIQSGFNMLAQSAADGAKPILFAALAPTAEPGGYYGPANLSETRGPPTPAKVMPNARDAAAAARLWAVSAALTHVGLPPQV